MNRDNKKAKTIQVQQRTNTDAPPFAMFNMFMEVAADRSTVCHKINGHFNMFMEGNKDPDIAHMK